MKKLIPLCWLSLAMALPLAGAGPSEPVAIFDGESFAGWEGNREMWRIEDDALVGGTLEKAIPKNDFLCTTRRYTNFVLRLKFKLVGEGANAGVQIRSERIPGHHEVKGYQADLGEPGWWGSLYDESRRNKVLAQSDMTELNPVLKRGEWNDYEIRCEGSRIRLSINGVETVDYTEADETIPQSGLIGLQIHSGPPSEAWYKEITIQELE